MKFLMLSGAGDGLGLAFRLRTEGNDVVVWIREERSKSNYDGLLRKTKRWEEELERDTIVVFDSNGGGKTADRLRARGYPVFAGSVFADQLESDRATAFDIMREVGIRVPNSQTFTAFDKAREYVRERDRRVVFKPSKEMREVMSYVAYDTEDMVEMLGYFEGLAKGKVEFELQDFVEGLEISTEGWFNGEVFLEPFNHTLERKQLMNDDLGPSGGCAGNIVWRCDHDKVVEQGINLMSDFLRHNEYVGPIDLNTIVNDEGVWALEFTPRFGYDAMPALLELIDQPVGELIYAMAKRDALPSMKLKDGFAAALRITIPPYPGTDKISRDIPVRGWVRGDRPHLYLYDVGLSDSNVLMSTSDYGVIAAATGSGDTISDAFKVPYELAERARIPNKQYRTDLPSLLEKRHQEFLSLVAPRSDADTEQRSPLEVPASVVGAPQVG